MKINWILKSPIVEQYGLQLVASGRLAIRDSYIVRGYMEPSPEERKVLERGLGHSVVQRRQVDESSRN